MHVKGMELPRQEPRVAKGFGLGHATSNRGADHLYALPAIDLGGAWDIAQRIFPAEIVPELMETDNEKYKAGHGRLWRALLRRDRRPGHLQVLHDGGVQPAARRRGPGPGRGLG